MNSYAAGLILRQRRALRAARNMGYRLLHGAGARAFGSPLSKTALFLLLAVTGLILAARLIPGAYAYFNSVRHEEMIISIDGFDAGAVLKGKLTSTAFEPAPAAVEMASSLPRAWMETCVENLGKDPTEGLEILAILRMKDGDELRELLRETVDVSEQPVIQPGEKHCYAYPLAAEYDPEQIYQAVAKVSVTNLGGWLPNSENCPGTEPCRKGIKLIAEFRVPEYASPSPQPSESPTPTSTPTPFDTAQPTPTETPILPPTETPVLPPTETPVNPTPTETPVPQEPTPTAPEPTSTPPPTITPDLPPTSPPPPPTDVPTQPPPEPTTAPPTEPPPEASPTP